MNDNAAIKTLHHCCHGSRIVCMFYCDGVFILIGNWMKI